MSQIFALDWAGMFKPDLPMLEIFIRGTVIYLGLFLLLRVVLKRETGSLSITDLLVVVLIADAAQNGMAGTYQSITDGLLLVGTIIFWSFFLDWLGYHIPAFERLIHPAELLLVENGRMLRRNMRKELVTTEELFSMLREQGYEDLSQIDKVYMEGDGQISIITHDKSTNNKEKKRQQT